MSDRNSIEVEIEVLANAETEIADVMDGYTAEQARQYMEEAKTARILLKRGLEAIHHPQVKKQGLPKRGAMYLANGRRAILSLMG